MIARRFGIRLKDRPNLVVCVVRDQHPDRSKMIAKRYFAICFNLYLKTVERRMVTLPTVYTPHLEVVGHEEGP